MPPWREAPCALIAAVLDDAPAPRSAPTCRVRSTSGPIGAWRCLYRWKEWSAASWPRQYAARLEFEGGLGGRDMSVADLPVRPPVAPMLAKLARELPSGDYIYEPKWDGFRCIVFRSGSEVELGSRNELPLTRYFPELVAALSAVLPDAAGPGRRSGCCRAFRPGFRRALSSGYTRPKAG